MKYTLTIFFLIFSWPAYPNDKDLLDTVNNLRDKTAADNNTFREEIKETYEAMQKRIAVPEVSIPEYRIFKGGQAKIMESFGLPQASDIIPGAQAEGSCLDPRKLGDFRIFIFISSSVPEVTLKNYMRDALKLKDALLVIRGVIGSADFLKPTQDFITQISCGKKMSELKPEDKCDITRVDINPLLFSLFKIDKAPAIVYSNLSYQELMIRTNTGKALEENDYFILRGDMPLAYALEKFQDAGTDTAGYLELLKGSY